MDLRLLTLTYPFLLEIIGTPRHTTTLQYFHNMGRTHRPHLLDKCFQRHSYTSQHYLSFQTSLLDQ